MDLENIEPERIEADSKKTGQSRKLLTASLIFYFLCSASVLLLPLSESKGSRINQAGYALALLFWIGLITGTVLFILSWRKIKDIAGYKEKKEKLRAGFINFFHGRSGVATDCILLLSLAVTLAGNYMAEVPYFVTVAGMFLFLFMLFLHSVINGRVWKYTHES